MDKGNLDGSEIGKSTSHSCDKILFSDWFIVHGNLVPKPNLQEVDGENLWTEATKPDVLVDAT